MPTVYNKVVIDGVTKIDLSQDTVTEAGHILTGHTGHLANGNQVSGTGSGSVTEEWVVIVSDNLHDTSEDVANTYINGSTETSYNNWTSTGYIPVKPNTWYVVKNFPGNNYNALYKSDKTAEKGALVVPRSTGTDNYGFIKTTSNTAYIRMSGATEGVSEYEIYETANQFPAGNIAITTNGTVNVSQYETATVNVSSGSPTLQAKTNIAPSTSSQTITADSGYDGLSSVQINAMPSGTAGTPTATKGTVSNHSITVTPSVTNSAGYIASETKTGIGVTVAASELDSGTKSITSNGTSIDVVGYAAVDVAVPTGVDIPIFTVTWDSDWETIQLTTCNKTYSECCALFDNDGIGMAKVIETNGLESHVLAANVSLRDYQESFIQYTVSTFGGNTVDIKYDDLNETLVATYPSVYNLTLNVTENGTYIPESDEGVYTEVNVSVPTGIARSASDITVSGNTVTIPAGLYSTQATKSVANGSAGTPTASKGTVSNHSITVTPSVTNTTGYITGGTKTGTGVTVSASELVSGSQTISANGTVDVTNLASVNVALTFSTITTSSSSPTGGSNGDIWIKTS